MELDLALLFNGTNNISLAVKLFTIVRVKQITASIQELTVTEAEYTYQGSYSGGKFTGNYTRQDGQKELSILERLPEYS